MVLVRQLMDEQQVKLETSSWVVVFIKGQTEVRVLLKGKNSAGISCCCKATVKASKSCS
ncbi:hypothetical protein F511_19675 [Dorcoceras hygrometricum]|uniref:Uncharacterized protein n=1 Tax=Dorcoceras hygrometricum TaxID=472368 RepID=A0A2Z7C672_9LAMI|nr:hypothetical protein F511_19675 [Dorcoceras hygrometricum]